MKILVADDHPLVRAGVRVTLERSEDFELVGEAADGLETLRLVSEKQPDLVLLDLHMPGPSGGELFEKILDLRPGTKILILTSSADDKALKTIHGLPLSGYMLKDEAPENLLQACRAICQGAVWFSQVIANRLLTLGSAPAKSDMFTPRERQILELVGTGMDNAGIAKELSLAEQTVRNYASMIYEKIGVTGRVEALVWARENGFASGKSK